MAADTWSGGRRHGGGGGPWGWGRFFGAGEVRLALLSLLENEPKHGYQLMKDLEDRSGGLYRASAGTIYPTLQLLEDEGWWCPKRRTASGCTGSLSSDGPNLRVREPP